MLVGLVALRRAYPCLGRAISRQDHQRKISNSHPPFPMLDGLITSCYQIGIQL